MKLKSNYKSEVYYFALNSMLRNNEVDKRYSKRAKKQIDFIKTFIDSVDANEVKKNVKGGKDERNI